MLIKQTLLYLPAQLLAPLSQFIAAIVWTHLLDLGDYGDLIIIISAQELASVVCFGWWTYYAMRYIGEIKSPADRGRYQASENTVLFCAGLLQVILIVFVIKGFVRGAAPELIAAGCLYTLTKSYLTHGAERARVKGDILSYSLAQTFGPVFGLLLGLGLMQVMAHGPFAALLGFVVAQFVSLVIVWLRLDLGLALRRPDRALMQSALRYGIPLLLAGGCGWASTNGIRLVVEQARGAAAVGLISVGWGLGLRAISVVAMLVTAASFPIALRFMNAGAREKSLEQVSLNGALLYSILAPTTAGLSVVGATLINLAVAQPFRAMSIVILPIALLAAALRNARVHFIDQIFFLVERPTQLFWINALEAVATLTFCFMGLEIWDLPGAAFGCLLGTLAGLLYGLALSLSHGLKLPFLHFFKISTAAIAMTVWLEFLHLQETVIGLGLRILSGMVIYFLVIGLLYVGDLRKLELRRLIRSSPGS